MTQNMLDEDPMAKCSECCMPMSGSHLPDCPYLQRKASMQERAAQRRAGLKLDQGKAPIYRGMHQQFPNAMEAVAHHTITGLAEPGHTWKGWLAVVNGYIRYTDAMERHLLEEAKLDVTSVDQRALMIEAATAVAWNSLARLEHLIKDSQE